MLLMHGCDLWHAGMELDMHVDPDRWSHRLAGVAGSVRALRSATVYINTRYGLGFKGGDVLVGLSC